MNPTRTGALTLCLLAIAACDKSPIQPKPVTAAEKAAFIAEMIEHRPECKPYREQLSKPGLDTETVDKLYREAVKTRCIEKDV